MLLTSYERAKRFLCVEDSAKNRNVINQYIYGISAQIENYLDRQFLKQEYTEFHNIFEGEREFWLKAVPVNSITSISVDPTGEFTGSETPLSNSYIGSTETSIVLQYAQIPAKRGLKIIYDGGVSTTTSLASMTLTSVIGAIAVNQFVETILGAGGLVKSYNSISKEITIDVLFGAFNVGDTLIFRANEDSGTIPSLSAVIQSKQVTSLVELLPNIALAVEVQMRYNVKTVTDFENKTVDQDSVSRRDTQTELTFRGAYQDLQPECRSLINGLRRYVFR